MSTRFLTSIQRILINAALLGLLAGLLVANLLTVIRLPTQLYTSNQLMYLQRANERNLVQHALASAAMPGSTQAPETVRWHGSYITATLAARYEEQEGVSATLYDLDFHGSYLLTYSGPAPTGTVELFFPFPGNLETLHQVRFLVDEEEPPEVDYSVRGIRWRSELSADKEHRVDIGYQAGGAGSFTYGLNRNQRQDLQMTIVVQGVNGSTIPTSFLPANERQAGADGETITWNYDSLIPNRDVRLELPAQLNFAQRVEALQKDFRTLAFLAPLLVALFLAALAAALHLRGARLPLEMYLLAGIGMALFYPLLTFLSGLAGVLVAGPVAFVLVSGLLLLFLGLAAGWRRAGWPAGLMLFAFLGVLSLGLLTPWRGLLLSGGGFLIVGGLMVLYARRPVPVAPPPELAAAPAPKAEPVLLPAPKAEPAPLPASEPQPLRRHCPYCGQALGGDFAFCPACGQDINRFRICPACGHEQFVPADLEPVHCTCCGKLLGGAE